MMKLHAAHEIAAMSAPQQLVAYAERLEAMAQSAELARLQLAPGDVRAVAVEIRASIRNLPASGIPALAAAADGSTASAFLTRDLNAAGLAVRKYSLESFDAAAKARGLPVESRMKLKTGLMRENLLATN